MSKAEERALKAYPVKIAQREGYDENLRERKGFIKGYHQAEKDLELTWKDIRLMSEIGEKFINSEESDALDEEEYYTEILNKFKAQKGESV